MKNQIPIVRTVRALTEFKKKNANTDLAFCEAILSEAYSPAVVVLWFLNETFINDLK